MEDSYYTFSSKELKLRRKIRDTYFKWEKYNELLREKHKGIKQIVYKIKRANAYKFLLKNGIKVYEA
jgi:hypothetical protein